MTERVTFLLDHGADPNVVSVYNQRTAYVNAMVMGRPDLAEYLLKRGAKAEPLTTREQLLSAISSRNKESIWSLLLKEPELAKGAEFLHHAAQSAGLEIVLELISKGFDINGLSHDGQTILHVYAWEGDDKAISTLLELGANPDIKDDTHQSTPLGFAIYAKSRKVVQLLTQHSENIIEVVACENVERAKILLARQPHLIYERSNNGQSLIHIIGFNVQSHGN